MAGFIRRFTSYPGTEQLTAIEGVNILDMPPPGSVQGVGVGTACIVGEFVDMRYAGIEDGTGGWTVKTQPVEVFSGKDMLDKVGGFDATLGDFGGAGGNGFVSQRNKKWSRLILAPISLASPKCARVFRKLPTNTSATNPAPVVPISAGSVDAGREFKTSLGVKVRLATRVTFASTDAYLTGIGASVTEGLYGPAETGAVGFSGGQKFLTGTSPVAVGDILVLGVIGAAGAQGTNADTYRVTEVSGEDTLVVEKMDGGNFNWATGVSLAWRLHAWDCADSADGASGTAAAYTLPARPMTATITEGLVLEPVSAEAAPTATACVPLAGLRFMVQSGGDGLVFAAQQGNNAVNSSALDTLYSNALASLITEELPAREINLVVCSRKSSTIRSSMKAHVLAASASQLGHECFVAPQLTSQSLSPLLGDADPGVGANRDERVIFCWPGAQTFIPEASGIKIKTATGTYTTDGILDTHWDEWVASLCSVIPPERNPGEFSGFTSEVLAGILGVQRGVSGLGMNEYIAMRRAGIAGLRMDKKVGAILQSGITTSLESGRKNINRRRMADFIEDSLAARFVIFSKRLLSEELKGIVTGETFDFLQELLSPNNPAAQRISGFIIDRKSGNTPELEAKGIWFLIVKVRTLASMDALVLQCEIGEGVTVTVA